MIGVDYLILGVIGVSALTSLLRGIISEVMSLLVWAVALWVSATASGAFASAALGGIEQPTVRFSVAFIGLFLLVLMVGGMLTWLIRRLVAKSGMSSTDRLLGLFFGLARGLLVVFSAVLLAEVTALPKQPWWQASALIPALQIGALAVVKHLPANVQQYVRSPDTVAPAPAKVPAERAPKP